ncbi:hypothetical protein PYCCODRAFT_623509 [Trametes coccinea BRFM310]|uniref:Uncharacterized protein n=1 Tax=Trametes coccinea (strain BRFM310) TaxID=1353009 RepID=A0A1Y2J2I6_TRAC3|nr:hypothetical protein PYCCODRAFT_623509 [Trametes coccinea BRFM310]
MMMMMTVRERETEGVEAETAFQPFQQFSNQTRLLRSLESRRSLSTPPSPPQLPRSHSQISLDLFSPSQQTILHFLFHTARAREQGLSLYFPINPHAQPVTQSRPPLHRKCNCGTPTRSPGSSSVVHSCPDASLPCFMSACRNFACSRRPAMHAPADSYNNRLTPYRPAFLAVPGQFSSKAAQFLLRRKSLQIRVNRNLRAPRPGGTQWRTHVYHASRHPDASCSYASISPLCGRAQSRPSS